MPAVSSLLLWLFGRTMKTNIKKDMAGLKELCETGKVAARRRRECRDKTRLWSSRMRTTWSLWRRTIAKMAAWVRDPRGDRDEQ
jgi:hypothetical protein